MVLRHYGEFIRYIIYFDIFPHYLTYMFAIILPPYLQNTFTEYFHEIVLSVLVDILQLKVEHILRD